jgi:hypothetical protein
MTDLFPKTSQSYLLRAGSAALFASVSGFPGGYAALFAEKFYFSDNAKNILAAMPPPRHKCSRSQETIRHII